MNKTIGLVLRAIALAMSIAVIVLGIIGSLSSDTGLTLIGIGLFALALESFLKKA
jgi:hypothetical protein